MNWTWLYFSFNGRLNRKPYWIGGLLLVVATMVVAAVLFAIGLPVLFALASILPLYPTLALGAKRQHDRDKSWTWLLVFFVLPSILQGIAVAVGDPVASGLLNLVGLGLSVWAFVELGCLRGTTGPNRYGPDPIARAATAAT